MWGKSKQIYLLKEDAEDGCRAVTSSSYGHLWEVLSRPLIWHSAVYDFLMTLFFMIVFALLFHNFV